MSTNRGNIKKNDIEENILKNDIKEKYLNYDDNSCDSNLNDGDDDDDDTMNAHTNQSTHTCDWVLDLVLGYWIDLRYFLDAFFN